jgi:hypothetical protein
MGWEELLPGHIVTYQVPSSVDLLISSSKYAMPRTPDMLDTITGLGFINLLSLFMILMDF